MPQVVETDLGELCPLEERVELAPEVPLMLQGRFSLRLLLQAFDGRTDMILVLRSLRP